MFSDIAPQIELESPLLGGDLGVGKSVIREILNEISRPRNPPLNPSQEGNNLCNLHRFAIVTMSPTGVVCYNAVTRLSSRLFLLITFLVASGEINLALQLCTIETPGRQILIDRIAYFIIHLQHENSLFCRYRYGAH